MTNNIKVTTDKLSKKTISPVIAENFLKLLKPHNPVNLYSAHKLQKNNQTGYVSGQNLE